MSKRIDSEKLKPSQFPLISFASRGTLLHETPPFEAWLKAFLQHQQISFSQEEVDEAILQAVSEMNREAEESEFNESSFTLLEKVMTRFLGESFAEKKSSIVELYQASQKFVIPKFVVDVLQSLKERGFRLCIISNEHKELVEVLRLYHLLDLFEAVILAEEVGVAKPNPEIFKLAAEDLDVEISQVLHIGDLYSHDVVAAQKAGAKAVLYDPLEYQAKSVLRGMKRSDEASSEKVVSFDELRKNRFWSQAIVIHKFEELTDLLVGGVE